MPIIKSAIKRVRQTQRKTASNNIRKRFLKISVKDFLELVDQGKLEEAKKLLPTVQKRIDLAVKNKLWHKNKASRQKSQLMKMIDGKKTVEKKASVKKEKKVVAE
jgi:small subunit ribosomal protein S20